MLKGQPGVDKDVEVALESGWRFSSNQTCPYWNRGMVWLGCDGGSGRAVSTLAKRVLLSLHQTPERMTMNEDSRGLEQATTGSLVSPCRPRNALAFGDYWLAAYLPAIEAKPQTRDTIHIWHLASLQMLFAGDNGCLFRARRSSRRSQVAEP